MSTKIAEHLVSLDDTAPRVYIYATGAGAGIVAEIGDVLQATPGASNFLENVQFGYDEKSTTAFLGYKPEKFVLEETAIALAMQAYMRAYIPGRKTIGIGLTATIAGVRERKGGHRIICSLIADDMMVVCTQELNKGIGTEQRAEDNKQAVNLILELLELAVRNRVEFSGGNAVTLRNIEEKELLDLLLARPYISADGSCCSGNKELDNQNSNLVLFPGSFNPVHEGHFGIADKAVRRSGSGRKILFSINVNSHHKGEIESRDLLRRISGLRGNDIYLTRDEFLYTDKIKRPGIRYLLMGVDSFQRMLDSKWGQNHTKIFAEFLQKDITLIVADRHNLNYEQVLDNLGGVGQLPKIIDLDTEYNISSTEIREGKKNAVLA